MRGPRGNRMAKASVETACWDLEAKRLGVPLWRHLGGVRPEIPCGVSIGIQDTPERCLEKIERELAAGYQRIKIKIKPGWDRDVVEQVRARFPDIRLMVDANSAYTLEDAPLLRALDEFDLMMIEQPLAYDDREDHAKLQRQIKTPVCLDESVRSAEDARKAIELGACRIVNVKLGRVGGHAEAARVEAVCSGANVPVWCGGMLEVGHRPRAQHRDGDARAASRCRATCRPARVTGPRTSSTRPSQSRRRAPSSRPTRPGIGFEIKRDLIERLTVRSETLNAH